MLRDRPWATKFDSAREELGHPRLLALPDDATSTIARRERRWRNCGEWEIRLEMEAAVRRRFSRGRALGLRP